MSLNELIEVLPDIGQGGLQTAIRALAVNDILYLVLPGDREQLTDFAIAEAIA